MTVKPYEALLPELRSLKPEPSSPAAPVGGPAPATAPLSRYICRHLVGFFSGRDTVIPPPVEKIRSTNLAAGGGGRGTVVQYRLNFADVKTRVVPEQVSLVAQDATSVLKCSPSVRGTGAPSAFCRTADRQTKNRRNQIRE